MSNIWTNRSAGLKPPSDFGSARSTISKTTCALSSHSITATSTSLICRPTLPPPHISSPTPCRSGRRRSSDCSKRSPHPTGCAMKSSFWIEKRDGCARPACGGIKTRCHRCRRRSTSVSPATDRHVRSGSLERLRAAIAARTRQALAIEPASDATSDRFAPARRAAVLVLIVGRDEPLQLVLFERPLEVAEHKGEICFPGGSIEAGDADAVSAALREASEELGIPPDDVEVLGC